MQRVLLSVRCRSASRRSHVLARCCRDRCGHGEPAALDDAVVRATVLANPSMSPGWPADGSFFVSIAAYRDPDLFPTIADGLAKARHPERLRFGICWQYGSELTGSEHLSGSQFAVHYVDARLSRGVCWARAEIMKLYDGEDWYLQLDSHHRFTQDWDEKLVEQAELTGSPRPVLSTYAAGFTPDREAEAAEHVTTMEFDCFTEHGVLLPKSAIVPEPRVTPIRARFLSAHFLLRGDLVRSGLVSLA